VSSCEYEGMHARELLDLPVELLEAVLVRLGPTSAARASRCCRAFAACVADRDFATRCCAVLGRRPIYGLEELAVLEAIGPSPPRICFSKYTTMIGPPDPEHELSSIARLMRRHPGLELTVHGHGAVATERRARAVLHALCDANVPRGRMDALGWAETISKPCGWRPTAQQRASGVPGCHIDVACAEVFFTLNEHVLPPLPEHYTTAVLPEQEPDQDMAALQARVALLSPYARCDD
jgi:hypothetical protein